MVAVPVFIRHNIFYREGSSGRFDVTVNPKQTMGKTVRLCYVLSISNAWYCSILFPYNQFFFTL